MNEFIKYVAIGWIGCMIRNKKDREITLKFLNDISVQAEKIVGDIMPKAQQFMKGGTVNDEPIETVSNDVPAEQRFE
ncbi:MAG: hypothetical protein FWF92_07645 [Oscillospiraceae bacterium]|nr:hypothetical protein [Oscillospiraceae bacterium]